MKQFQEFPHIVEMEAGRRLVQNIERPAGGSSPQLAGEFDPLRLTAGKRRRGLIEAKIIETDFSQRAQFCVDGRDSIEQLQRLIDRHRQHIRDAPAFVFHRQRLAVVARAFADITGDCNFREKIHIDPDDAVAGAGIAAAGTRIERKTIRSETANPRLGQLREELPDRIEKTGISRRSRARRAPDGSLIDADHPVKQLRSD